MKLSRQQDAERDALIDRLNEARAALEEKIDAANAAIGEANEARDAFNSHITDAQEFVDGIASEIEDFINEKSERWQEGEKGQAATAMLGEWQGYSFETLDEYEEIARPDDPAELLAQLPTDPSNFE
jgi:uncharacterized membrane-anchored protein YjiN (DUF445 family)